MKFIISVDLEGVACAYAPYGGSLEDSFNIVSIRKQATLEVNAAAQALFDSGATEVIVWDSHGRGCSLEYENLDERCKIAIGSTIQQYFPVWSGSISDCSGILLIGHHGKAGTSNAAIAHTYCSQTYQEIKINDKEYGEIGIAAAIAGENGVPVIFVSGDDMAVIEAKEILPWIETVETKKSFAYTRIISNHPHFVVKEIYASVKRSIKRLNEMKIFTFDTPLTMEIRYRRQDTAQHARLIDLDGNPFEFMDAYTRKGKLKKAEEIPFRL